MLEWGLDDRALRRVPSRNGLGRLLRRLLTLDAAWRDVKVTHRRAALDFAYCMRELVDFYFPEAEVVRVVLDNLNTHTPASLYQAFPAEEAQRITERPQLHHTPKHASWLNMAEVEFSALGKQCLDRRPPSMETGKRETSAWSRARSESGPTIQWRFTTTMAQERFRSRYPSPQAR